MGVTLRKQTPRRTHGAWSPPADRADPISLLEQQAETRVPELVPIRYGRMMASPFTFLRGSALVMARDLETTPTTGLTVQCCGDAHLSNFGFYGSPERTLVFDINDFDETMPGPWEFDLKRLAASIEVAGRSVSFDDVTRLEAVQSMAQTYRNAMGEFAERGNMDVWYAHISADNILARITDDTVRKRTSKVLAKARSRTSLGSLDKLVEVVDGQQRLIENPPVVVRVDTERYGEILLHAWLAYLESLPDDRRQLLDQFRFVDVARKVVGVGSVGTRAFVVLFDGRDERDPLFLQFKHAQRSVLEGPNRTSAYENQGQRVVVGQHMMQAASDIFLGWIRGDDGNDYYWRQLRDMKGSIEIEGLRPDVFVGYARLCGLTLARAHARSGDRVELAAYLGNSGRFDQAIAAFAEAYADQTERDHAALVAAVKQGRLQAAVGV
jgi:uncharacterized protein (DUF2252 family)